MMKKMERIIGGRKRKYVGMKCEIVEM